MSGEGAWSHLGDAGIARLLATSGFDWVGMDGQHGAFHRAALLAALTGAGGDWAPVMVRVPANDPAEIGFALDIGAAGVIVPMVDSAADAQRAVAAAAYPPLGVRSWGPISGQWGTAFTDATTANGRVEVWVMIETRGGLESVEAIAAVPGVTGLFVGPNDLSLSLGTSIDALVEGRDSGSPLDRIRKAAAAASVTAAAYGGGLSAAFRSAGFTTLAVGSDVDFLAAGVHGALGAGRTAAAKSEGSGSWAL